MSDSNEQVNRLTEQLREATDRAAQSRDSIVELREAKRRLSAELDEAKKKVEELEGQVQISRLVNTAYAMGLQDALVLIAERMRDSAPHPA